jgi:hypothetical protein
MDSVVQLVLNGAEEYIRLFIVGLVVCGKRKNFYSTPREDAVVMEWNCDK